MNPPLPMLRALAAGGLPPDGLAAVREEIARAWPDAPVELVDHDPAALCALIEEAEAPGPVAPSALGVALGSALGASGGDVDVVEPILGRLGQPRSAVGELGAALAASAGPAPDVARGFDPAGAWVGDALRAALAAYGADVDVADAVMARLGLQGRTVGLGVLREAWAAEPPAAWSAWAGVAAQLEAEGAVAPGWAASASVPPVADAVRGAAGPTPEIRAAAGGAVVADASVAALPAPANAVGARASALWAPALGAVMALAAAWALWVGSPGPSAERAPADALAVVAEAYGEGVRLAGVGEVNVDELASDESVSVFVELPMGDDAPLIISVDEGVAL